MTDNALTNALALGLAFVAIVLVLLGGVAALSRKHRKP